jgi:hypothetical protein
MLSLLVVGGQNPIASRASIGLPIGAWRPAWVSKS